MKLQKKMVLLAAVAMLIVASCGCTVTTTPSDNNQAGNVNTAYPTSGRSDLIHALVNQYNDEFQTNDNHNYTVTWINNTAVRITYDFRSLGSVYAESITITQYPSISAASAYFDSQRPLYNFKPSTVPYIGLYQEATGSANQTVMKGVERTTGDTIYDFSQIDTVIIATSHASEPINQA